VLLWSAISMKVTQQCDPEQVPASRSRLQSGDVFILDMGLKVYQWNGSSASVFEKHKVIIHFSTFNVDYVR